MPEPMVSQIQAGYEDYLEEKERREVELESPANVALREQSQHAYENLTPAELQDLINATFGDVLKNLDGDPARFLSDATVLDVVEPDAATVRSDGDSSLFDAGVPVQAENELGELRKVDLSLVQSEGDWVPENPLVDVEVGSSAEEGLELGEENIGITQVGAEDASATLLGDMNLLFSDISEGDHTDLLVSPTSRGVELFDVLRSIDSPENLRFKFDLPAGSVLRPAAGGAAEVLGADGEPSLQIPAPWARDAQGSDVPVAMTVEGNQLVLAVDHQEGDFAYPILVDPAIYQDWGWWYEQKNMGGIGYFTPQLSAGNTWTQIGTKNGSWPTWDGLAIATVNGTHGSGTGGYAITAPNTNSYIAGATINPFYRNNAGCSAPNPYPHPYDYAGLWNGTSWYLQYETAQKQGWFTMAGPGTWGTQLSFGLGTAGGTIPCWRHIMAGGIGIWLDDWAGPGFTAPSGAPSGWIDGKTSFTIATTTSDAGLGVNRVKLLSADQSGQPIVGEKHPSSCTGLYTSRCPTSFYAAFTQTGGSFGQGVRSAKIYVSDPTGKSAESASIPLKVDLTPPDVTLEGKLAAATDADEGEAKGDEDVETLRLPVYNLTVKATDVGNETNTEHRKRSGVKEIEIWLQEEGQPKKEMPVPWTPTPSCAASCPKEGTYKLELSKLDTAGTHRLEVRTVDFVGNEKVRDIEFEYFPATGMKDEYLMHYFPLPDGQGNEAEEEHPQRPELAVNVMNGNLVYRQVDVDVESSAAVDLELERYYNSMLPDSEDTEWGEGWTLAETPDLNPIGASALAAAATMAASPSGAERYFSLWLDMPTPAGARTGYELSFKYVAANTYDVAICKWQAGAKTQLAAKTGLTFAVGSSLALVDEGATVSAWTDTGSGFVQRLSATDSAFDQGKTGLLGAGNITRISKFKAGELNLDAGIPAALAAMPVTEVFDGSSASNSRFAAEWSALGWAGGGTPKGGTTTAGWRPVDAFATASNGAFYNKNLVSSGGGAEEAELLDSSGGLESDILLPSAEGQEKFDPALQATLKKKADGGYLMTDETGESATAVAFDGTGQTEALVTEGDAMVDYSYEEGELAEIAVEDPGTLQADPSEVESSESQATEGTPLFHSAFGSLGAGDSQFNTPTDVAIGPEGDLWVADYANHRLQHFNPAGEYVGKFGSQGSAAGKLSNPASIAIDAEGNLWVADKGNSRIQKFSPEGDLLDGFGSLGSGHGQFSQPEGIAIDASGDIWVSDTYNYRIQKFSAEGDFIEVVAPEGLGGIEPTGIDAGPDGRVWVADWTNNRVAALSEDGDFELSFGTTGSGPGQFNHPDAIEADESGNVWVGDQDNGRIQRFDQEGNFVDQFGAKGSGPGQFSFAYPFGFAVGEDLRVWVADRNNNRVQRWDPPFEPAEEVSLPGGDDPSVEVTTNAGLVETVSGDEAGETAYEHSNGLLTSVDGPDGETAYEYKDGRMTKVTLPNGTSGTISYFPDGRVETVTVAPEGASPKTTRFAYTDVNQRKTEVEVPEAPNITYELGDDGSLLKWWNTAQPPELILYGNLYDQKEEEGALWSGDYQLAAEAEDVEGIASIEVLAGNALVERFNCQQVGGPPPECTEPDALPWVMETESYAPGRLQIEVIATDSDGESTSERFWVDVPEPPPPPAPGTPLAPRFSEIKTFREDYGLEIVFPVANATERNERIFNLINAWHEPNTPLGQVARASQERWGVPLRPEDVAELEYRDRYLAQASSVIPAWAASNVPGTYAGFYMDHRSGGLVRVGFTANQASSVAQLEAAAGLMAPDRIATFPYQPTRTLATLESSLHTASQIVTGPPAPPGIVSVSLDIPANRLRLGTTEVAATEAFAAGSFGSGAGVTVAAEAPSQTFAGRYKAGVPFLAATYIRNTEKECMAGFGAWKRYGRKPNGEIYRRRYVLTAGHCFPKTLGASSTVYRPSYKGDLGVEIGKVELQGFTGDPNRIDTDAEAIEAENGLIPSWIYECCGGNASMMVTGVAFPRAGETVCQSSQFLDRVTCGPVTNVGDFDRLEVDPKTKRLSGWHWMIRAAVGGGRGDSGGPVWMRETGEAVGLVAGGGPEGLAITPFKRPPNATPGQIAGIFSDPSLSERARPLHVQVGK